MGMGKEYSYQIAVTCEDGCRFEMTDKGKAWGAKEAIGELLKQLKKIRADEDAKRLRQLEITLSVK